MKNSALKNQKLFTFWNLEAELCASQKLEEYFAIIYNFSLYYTMSINIHLWYLFQGTIACNCNV
jgi:hypothetical protein